MGAIAPPTTNARAMPTMVLDMNLLPRSYFRTLQMPSKMAQYRMIIARELVKMQMKAREM